jgi:3'-phosphoadenosine 5'-phosphosulfate sulfotransferase (PAPS reductase)/FAD synthetase
VPDETREVLAGGSALAVSISGGKDSQAMLAALAAEHRSQKWPGVLLAIHADLGRAEWPQSLGHCQQQCDDLGIELVVVRRPRGDMVDRWEQEMRKMMAEGNTSSFWSDSQNRYCTSELKRDQIDKYLRRYSHVVCAVGIRAEESDPRAQKPVWAIRAKINTKGQKRRAYTWNAIKDWMLEDVWARCGASSVDLERRRMLHREGFHKEALEGWPFHPAYVFGNSRLSCSLCVLADRTDKRNGAIHNPELYQILTSMERESGWSFRRNDALVHLFDAKPKGIERVPLIVEPPAQHKFDFTCSC